MKALQEYPYPLYNGTAKERKMNESIMESQTMNTQSMNRLIEIILEESNLKFSEAIDTQSQLINIWQEILGIPVDCSSNFFNEGGHSLTVMQVIGKINTAICQELGSAVPGYPGESRPPPSASGFD